ncbi:MAG: hypothetical protein LJE74_10865 [Proteobacteria bacterium]|nr:hypothetical protein [Pseudomonadota bacterium]
MTRCSPSFLTLVILAGLISPAQSDDVLGDISIPREETTSTSTTPLAVFPHWKHRMYFKCNVCHETLFQMQAGADHITMDAIRDGQFCAVCHDGKTAFEVSFDTCELCHSAVAAGAP